jgi:DNA-binding transcriptional MocR family regulator
VTPDDIRQTPSASGDTSQRPVVCRQHRPRVSQLALAELLRGGGYERHLRAVRGDYARAVTRHFPPGTRITQPAGGFVIWVELAPHVNSLELAHRARSEGISIAPGPIFSATQKYRISCASRVRARGTRASRRRWRGWRRSATNICTSMPVSKARP